jgi:hypothetical protein
MKHDMIRKIKEFKLSELHYVKYCYRDSDIDIESGLSDGTLDELDLTAGELIEIIETGIIEPDCGSCCDSYYLLNPENKNKKLNEEFYKTVMCYIIPD